MAISLQKYTGMHRCQFHWRVINTYSESQLNKDKINDSSVLVTGAQEPIELIQKIKLYTAAKANDHNTFWFYLTSTPEDSLLYLSMPWPDTPNKHVLQNFNLCIM